MSFTDQFTSTWWSVADEKRDSAGHHSFGNANYFKIINFDNGTFNIEFRKATSIFFDENAEDCGRLQTSQLSFIEFISMEHRDSIHPATEDEYLLSTVT